MKRVVVLTLAALSVGCGGVDDGASEVPVAEPRVDAAPPIVQNETLPTGPRVTMEHEHAVDPASDLAAARASLSNRFFWRESRSKSCGSTFSAT